jgi:hypothetical protein
MLGIGSANCTDSAQFAHAIGGIESSNSVNPRVSIGCVRGIQLVAASDPLDSGEIYDGILYGKAKSPATPNTLEIPMAIRRARTCSITVLI